MIENEPEILAVRKLPPGMAEPTDESVSRTWHLMTRRRALAEKPQRPLMRWAVPVGAAATVAALAITAAVVLKPGSGGGQNVGSPGQAPASVGNPQIDLPQPGDGTNEGGVDGKKPVPNNTPATADAVAALNALATAASHGAPVHLRTGQLIYVSLTGTVTSMNVGTGQSGTQPESRGFWFDPQGAILMKLVMDGHDTTNDPKSDMPGQIADARAYLAEHGPGIHNPTPQWLAGLPTDPAALREKLRKAVAGEAPAWSTDHELWNAFVEFYVYGDQMASPQTRAALLRAFTGLKGLTAHTVTVDGKTLIGIRHTERNQGDEILFDPATGRGVGRASYQGGALSSQETWSQAIVGSVNDTH